MLSVVTATSVVLGVSALTAAPAEAQVHFGIGIGNGYDGYGDGFYGDPNYGDDFYGYPEDYSSYDDSYGWHRHHHWRDHHHLRCEVITFRRHHHWMQRRVCHARHYY